MIKEETITACAKQAEELMKYKFTKEGNELFISTLVAETEQVENMHLKTKINDLVIECDTGKPMGGSGLHASPMQLLLVSIASCLEQTALLTFHFNGVDIKSLKVKIEATYDKRSILGVKPGFYEYNITWFIETSARERKVQRVLKKVEELCPVRGSLINPKYFSEEIVIVN